MTPVEHVAHSILSAPAASRRAAAVVARREADRAEARRRADRRADHDTVERADPTTDRPDLAQDGAADPGDARPARLDVRA